MKKFFSITLASLLLSSSLCSSANAECAISEGLKKYLFENTSKAKSATEFLENLKGNVVFSKVNFDGLDFSDITDVVEKIKNGGKLDISSLLQNFNKENAQDKNENSSVNTNNGEENKEQNEEPKQPESTVITGENAKFISEVIRLVNEERAKMGLSQLASTDANLQKAAQIRAREQESVFSHTRPNGQSCFTVLAECSVSYSGAGENIAMGQTNPEQVMNGWMNSEGHRKNILNPNFTKIGVGCHRDSNGRYYWSQMFVY